MLNPVVHNITTKLHRFNTLGATVNVLDINELETVSQDLHPIWCLEFQNDYYNRLL